MDTSDPQTYAIIGAAMKVHRVLGPGFLEHVYREAFALELRAQEVPHRCECSFRVMYGEIPLEATFRADFVCFDSIIVELKALRALTRQDQCQAINYMKASGLSKALLFNFGADELEFKRMVGPSAEAREHH